jgi:hypothetical protein
VFVGDASADAAMNSVSTKWDGEEKETEVTNVERRRERQLEC